MENQARTDERDTLGESPPVLAQAIAYLAGVIDSDDFPPGERASLRRWAPGEPPSLGFYRFAFRHLPDNWERRGEEWMTFLTCLALMCPRPHRPDVPLGTALAQTGYAESRLERLLATEGRALHILLLRAARFLRAKNAGCNCIDIADLLGIRSSAAKSRLRIARSYYHEIRTTSTPQ